jgi:hypothetical protein
VVALSTAPAKLVMVLAHGVPLVRPDDVLAGLARVWPAFAPPEPPVLTRLSQGLLDRATGTILEVS